MVEFTPPERTKVRPTTKSRSCFLTAVCHPETLVWKIVPTRTAYRYWRMPGNRQSPWVVWGKRP